MVKFNINDLNKLSKPLELNKRLEKAKRKGIEYVKTHLEDKNDCIVGIETLTGDD